MSKRLAGLECDLAWAHGLEPSGIDDLCMQASEAALDAIFAEVLDRYVEWDAPTGYELAALPPELRASYDRVLA